jgi:signal transduction protein with GAF and PtsI domain
MLADCREIIREVRIASNLEESLAILVRRVKDSLPVDAFAIYLTGAEAGQYVLKASDAARPRSVQVHKPAFWAWSASAGSW